MLFRSNLGHKIPGVSKSRNNVLLAASRLLGLVYLVAALVFEATLLVTDFLPKKWLLTLLIGVFIASAVLFIQLVPILPVIAVSI